MTTKRKNHPLTIITVLFSLLLMFLVNANSVLAADRTEQTSKLLLRAIEGGDLETAQAMLDSGADINYNTGETNAFSCTFYNILKDYAGICRFLISHGIDVNMRFNDGRTPLMYSIRSPYHNAEAINVLIDNGSNIHALDNGGNTALHHATVEGFGNGEGGRNIIVRLMSKGADINCKNKNGITPFLLYIDQLPSEKAGTNSVHLEFVKFLISKGADINISANNIKAIDLAYKHNNIPVYQYLLALENGTVQKPVPSSIPNSSTQSQPKPKSAIPAFVTEMPKDELSIGGIDPGQNIDYVEQVYGKPSKVDDEGFFKTYNYNDKFVVKAKMNNGFKVMSVGIYEKGLATPSGFTVGMPYANVEKKFGTVNPVKFKAEGVEAKLKGCMDYTYFSGNKQIVFLVDKKDIVQGIRVEELDEQKFIEAKRKK